MSTAETPWTWAWPWWGTLVAINAIHVIVGIFLFFRSKKENNPADTKYLKIMRSMSLIFIAVAFYRSIFVSSYLRQLAWFDSMLNSSLLIGRRASVSRMNEEVPGLVDTKNRLVTFLQTKTPIILFICIFLANIFATSATITKIALLFAIEETFWGLGFVSILPMLIIAIRRLSAY